MQVEILQRQIIRLKRCGMLVIGSLVVALVLAQTAPPRASQGGSRVVEAEKFVLKDVKGRVRGEWEVEDFPIVEGSSVRLKLRNAEGKVAAVLQNPSWGSAELQLLNKKTSQSNFDRTAPVFIDESGTGTNIVEEPHTSLSANSLFITDKERQSLSIELLEKPSISIDSNELHTQLGAGSLHLFSKNGTVALGTEPQPMMVLSAKEEKRKVLFSQFDDAFLLAVQVGDKFRARWDVGKTFNSISLFDEGGKKRAVLGCAELTNIATGESYSRKESSLVLFGEDGEVVFSEP